MFKFLLPLLLAAAPSFASPSEFPLASIGAAGLLIAPSAVEVPLPAPAADKASYIQLVSSVKLKMDKDKGELTIGFPKAAFGDPEPEDKSYLFVRLTRGLPAPALSWATVLCSGGHYLGYKGSNINFPEKSGSFSINETLALGTYPKQLIARTHPWLTEGLQSTDEVCSPAFLEKMKDSRAETLPQKLGDFSFDYNARKNTLKVKW
ncbi:MAG: hypothetical protein M0025_12905 [Elusimicrobia bacterium]|nr:hypothetical protein [Elusimicrobiota bacterium]MDA8245004.1 hypothetical protein [Elusimicrobiota bacterium]